jgi:guanine deaminase
MAAGIGGKSIFLGNFIHSKSLDELEYLHDTAVFVDEKGVIVAIENECNQKKAEETIFPQLGWTTGDISVKVAKAHQFFFPGFIGLLVHRSSRAMLTVFRYAYSCFSVPKCRYLWQINLTRLAQHLHLPLGKQLEIHPQSY